MSLALVLAVALIAIVATASAVLLRELRALRRRLGALDEAEGRRTATLLAGLHALREPLDALRVTVHELSPEGRATVERMLSSPPSTAMPATTGLRLDLPRASEEERESDGETRVVKQPSKADLTAAGAVPDAPARAVADPGRPRTAAPAPSSTPAPATLRAVCRLCAGSGVARARSGAVEDCQGCGGVGYIDPSAAQASPGASGRDARLPR